MQGGTQKVDRLKGTRFGLLALGSVFVGMTAMWFFVRPGMTQRKMIKLENEIEDYLERTGKTESSAEGSVKSDS
jgi:hypothetical protein